MRVYELAKEINISSKEICSFLSSDKKEYKTMNGLTDDEIKKVKDYFKKDKAAKVGKPKQDKADGGAAADKKADKAGDHTSTKVEKLFFPQNSKTSGSKNKKDKNDVKKKPEKDKRETDKAASSPNESKPHANAQAGGKQEAKSGKPQNRHNTAGKDKQKNKGKNKEGDISLIEKNKPKEKKKEDEIKQIVIGDYISIDKLAKLLKVQPSAIIKKLFLQGKSVTINTELTYEEAEEIALEYNVLCEREEKVDVIAELLKEDEDEEEKMSPRPPVVAVMGHVDHGKTSLLDEIRKTHVTDKESGGITQKIGAYQVRTKKGDLITFLDTPGHEAFTAMRMRGAQATDIAILVVAADDGVMPQTVEAIDHAKAAGVEIIVAINKIDKPAANVERVKQELMEHGLVPEEWGGQTIFVPVSAHTGEGIEELLDMIMLTADVLELKANKNRLARGIVIESELDKGKGVVATVLVQKGTLHMGNSVAAGSSYGKIRAIINDRGQKLKEAGPSVPVEILGLDKVPNAGEILMAFGNDKEARAFAETFVSEDKKKMVDESRHRVTLDDLFEQIKSGNVKELNLIVKADVQGSVEAIKQSLEKLSNDEVAVKIIHSGVGNISESDVSLASASNAIIIGFGVKLDNQAKATADEEEVDIRFYSVIYHAINDIEAALTGMLEPIFEKRVIGHAEIRQIFKASGIGNIAGSIVTDGKIKANSLCTVTRDGKEIYDGKIATLKHFKDDVKEVKSGTECGIVFDGFDDIKEGDIIEAAEMVEIPRT